ncbi:substrate-binding domain-containing protein [Parasalinivibrio latis]|uniref:LacI family DNA-binding transcriptional regulator n=1 Tax=Parasalinivibrio latis TaxID=2952610 RepID=UPI0030E46B10
MVTLKKIAKITGVAESTVSRILNRDSTLSVSTAKRTLVIETAERLQYVPRRKRNTGQFDKSVALRKPEELKSIVLVHFLSSKDELDFPFYLGLRKGIEARCEEYETNIVRVLQKDFDAAALNNVRHSGVLSFGELPEEDINSLNLLNIPLVLIHPAKPTIHTDSVYTNIESAAMTMCDWLMAKGIHRPALLGINSKMDGRYTGYKQRMELAGKFDPDLVFFRSNDMAMVDELFNRFDMGSARFPDALIVDTDQSAVEVYQSLSARGIRVPEDISVVGFNDSAIASALKPTLSTMRLDAGVIGEAAVDLLMERIQGRIVAKQVQVHPLMVQRESTI